MISAPELIEADNDQVDSYIASALGKLSMQERDRVYHEMHGVEEIIQENPEFVATKTFELEKRLLELKNHHPKRHAYLMAEATNGYYVTDTAFQLKFLRSEAFDVAKAADRMIRFFDIKMYLFGADRLCKDITISDLSKDDMATLKAGFMQMMPLRDRAGRAIFVLMPNFQTYAVAENMTRVMFYLLMSALDDEETQKRGLAAIIYNVEDFMSGKTDLKTVVQGTWIQACVPFKMCALHHCYNDAAFRVIVNVSMQFFGEEAKARAKMHHGTHVECVYKLMTFGIPPDALPVTFDGDLKRKNHLEWIRMRKYQEQNPQLPRILVPNRNDVLFGRGKPFREHLGNLRLFNLLDENLTGYENMKVREKSAMIADIVVKIKQEGGRFVKQDDHGVWIEVDDKQAREKVSHAVRTRLRITSSSREDAPSPISTNSPIHGRESPSTGSLGRRMRPKTGEDVVTFK